MPRSSKAPKASKASTQQLKKGLKKDPVIETKIAPTKKVSGVRLDNIQRPEKVQGLYKKV